MTLTIILEQLRAFAEARGQAILLARAASELPGIAATLDPIGIRLTARGLRRRAFGTRQRRRDPALALFARGPR